MILNLFSPRLWLANFYRKCLLVWGKFVNRNDDIAHGLYLRQSNDMEKINKQFCIEQVGSNVT